MSLHITNTGPDIKALMTAALTKLMEQLQDEIVIQATKDFERALRKKLVDRVIEVNNYFSIHTQGAETTITIKDMASK